MRRDELMYFGGAILFSLLIIALVLLKKRYIGSYCYKHRKDRF